MIVKGELKQAQIESITTAEEATAKHARGMVYLDHEKMHVLVSNGTSFIRLSSEPIGTIKTSLLSETQFQSEVGPEWILADGRDVTGSDYALLTGNTTVADLRGMFLRGKNNGRSDGKENPDGDLALGAFQSDAFQGHVHPMRGVTTGGPSGICFEDIGESAPINSSGPVSDGVNGTPRIAKETRPVNNTVNYFIKINR